MHSLSESRRCHGKIWKNTASSRRSVDRPREDFGRIQRIVLGYAHRHSRIKAVAKNSSWKYPLSDHRVVPVPIFGSLRVVGARVVYIPPVLSIFIGRISEGPNSLGNLALRTHAAETISDARSSEKLPSNSALSVFFSSDAKADCGMRTQRARASGSQNLISLEFHPRRSEALRSEIIRIPPKRDLIFPANCTPCR